MKADLDPCQLLLSCSADRCDPAALVLAGVIGTAVALQGTHGVSLPALDAAAARALLARWFPGAEALVHFDEGAQPPMERASSRLDEVDDLMSLLTDHADAAAGSAQAARDVAWAIAVGSLGDNHLWQDLRLPSRRELSALIGRWFPSLAARNDRDMKWKKFFYRQLCERENVPICKSPSCGVCSDLALCFGTEERAAPLPPLPAAR